MPFSTVLAGILYFSYSSINLTLGPENLKAVLEKGILFDLTAHGCLPLLLEVELPSLIPEGMLLSLQRLLPIVPIGGVVHYLTFSLEVKLHCS